MQPDQPTEPVYEGKTVSETAKWLILLCGDRAAAKQAAEMRARHAQKAYIKEFFSRVAVSLSDG